MNETIPEPAALGSTIAIIPCRGGSKRIPFKNVRLFHGKPLIQYTIEAAISSKVFDAVVVSTDAEEIANIARNCGAEVPFLRDQRLADDYAPVSAATVNALEMVDPAGDKFLRVAQLMANCPLRHSEDVQSSYEHFISGDFDSQISVTEYGWLNPWWAMTRTDQGILSPLFREQMGKRSQDLPRLYCPTGAIWWAKTSVVRKYGTFYVPDYTGWVMPWERALDIDTEDDWRMTDVLWALTRGNQ